MKPIFEKQQYKKWKLPLQLSADVAGETICYQMNEIRENQNRSQVYWQDLTEGGIHCIGDGSGPCISPDGAKIAFVRDRAIHICRIWGEKEDMEVAVCQAGEIAWDPDSTQICFCAGVKADAEPENLPKLSAAKWIDRTKFKEDEVGIFDGMYRQVFTFSTETQTLQQCSFSKSDKAHPFFAGKHKIVYTAVLEHTDVSDQASIVVQNLQTQEKQIFAGPGGPIESAVYLKAEDEIAVISHDNTYWEATNYQLYVLNIASGSWRMISRKCDRSVANVVLNDIGLKSRRFHLGLSQDGTQILAKCTDGYKTELLAFSKNREPEIVISGEQVITEAVGVKEGIVYVATDPLMPAKLVLWEEKKQQERVLYQTCKENESFVAPVRFSWMDEKNREMEALYYPAAGETKGIVLDIHGGPHYCHGICFSYDAQLRAAYGYASLLCNPAGSQGSGEALARESYHDWGGKDFRDLMACRQEAVRRFHLAQLPWAVMGGSYGGFMTNWIIGHTDAFACAISERSTCNRYSQAGTSDCAFRYGKFEFDGFAWEHPEHYMEHSPISYVKQIHTPVLLIHGDADMNCPISQSEEFYSALRMEQKEVYLAIMPQEYHSFAAEGKPACRDDRYNLCIWWMDRYMKECRKRDRDV